MKSREELIDMLRVYVNRWYGHSNFPDLKVVNLRSDFYQRSYSVSAAHYALQEVIDNKYYKVISVLGDLKYQFGEESCVGKGEYRRIMSIAYDVLSDLCDFAYGQGFEEECMYD